MKVLWYIDAAHVLPSVQQLIKHGHEVEIIFPTWRLDAKQCNLTGMKVHVVQNYNDLLNDFKLILNNTVFDYYLPSMPDALTDQVQQILQSHGLPCLSHHAAKCVSSKFNYYRIWKLLNIPTPKIYQRHTDIEYPCVVKPFRGQAGRDVKVLQNSNDVDQHIGKPEFLLQQWINGDVVSLMGTVVNGKIDIDLVYDIETDAWPWVSETGLVTPSKYSHMVDTVKTYLDNFFQSIKFDNTPFMLDIIVDQNRDIYFLDFAARLSINGQFLMQHGGQTDYVAKVLQRLQQRSIKVQLSHAVLFRQLGLLPGKINEISADKNLVDFIYLPEQVVPAVNDDTVYSNGFAIVTGLTRKEVEDKFKRCIDSIRVTYYNHVD